MRRLIICGMFLLGLSATGPAEDNIDQNGVNLLQAALDSIGYTYSDLGYRPKGYWNRFPTGIPYKLKSFDDLYAEPISLYNYARSFGGAVRRYCNPAGLDSADNNLYNLVYHLGIERKTGGFRSYGANLVDAPGGERPFIRAVENLYIMAGGKMQYVTFNQKADWPDLKKELSEKIATLRRPVRLALAGLMENLREAIYWRNLGVRNIPSEIINRVFYIRDLAETQGDGMKYYPEIDDAAQAVDFESVCYATLKVAAAAERAEKELTPLLKDVPRDFALDFITPYGRVVINGRGDNQVNGDYCLLIIDFGGDDSYTGSAGATSRPGHGVSVLIDLEGNDIYKSENMTPSFGAGILGVGLLYDAAGSDRYEGKVFSQGAGFLGLGMLFDKSGSDDYKSETSSQGAGYFGIGLAIDCAGDDSYYLYGDGQGMGGVGGGVGCLANYSGDDKYMAEPSPEIVNRADYHSQFKINANSAQGCGFGRRGDGSDGHSWAGGLGVIVDICGNDVYESGNWSLGCGYWFGTGICYDEAGDDVYRSVYFTQASGAHFCNGALIDESGDDKHILYETAGAAFAFGWDFTNALFVDRGGNDEYEAKMISYGLAQIRSFAFFFEMGGADSYTYAKGQQGFGAASFRDIYTKPSELRTYDYYTKSAGIFIDASGTDNYLIKEEAKTAASEKMKDNTIWFTPEKSDSNYGHNNFGIGIDADGGKIPELGIFD